MEYEETFILGQRSRSRLMTSRVVRGPSLRTFAILSRRRLIPLAMLGAGNHTT